MHMYSVREAKTLKLVPSRTTVRESQSCLVNLGLIEFSLSSLRNGIIKPSPLRRKLELAEESPYIRKYPSKGTRVNIYSIGNSIFLRSGTRYEIDASAHFSHSKVSPCM